MEKKFASFPINVQIIKKKKDFVKMLCADIKTIESKTTYRRAKEGATKSEDQAKNASSCRLMHLMIAMPMSQGIKRLIFPNRCNERQQKNRLQYSAKLVQ